MADSVVIRHIGAFTYVVPGHSVDSEVVCEALHQALKAQVENRALQIVLDFSSVSALGNQALNILFEAHRQVLAYGGNFQVINVNEVLQDVFVITGLCDVMHIVKARNLEVLRSPARTKNQHRRIGELLIEHGALAESQLAEAITLQATTNKQLGEILVEKNWITEAVWLQVLGEQMRIPAIKLRAGVFDPQTAELLGAELCRSMQVLPLFHVQQTISIATANPQNVGVLDEIRHRTGCQIRVVLARREEINATFKELADAAKDGVGDIMQGLSAGDDVELVESRLPTDYATVDEMAGDSPVINLVNGLLQKAIRDKASDIHIEPYRNRSLVRFRVDGVLYQVMTPRPDLHPAIVSRLKIMASLDIAERRLPQDGRIQVVTQGRTVDLRFSTLPGIYGEKVVLRVLDKSAATLELDKLGMAADTLVNFKKLLSRSHGLILVTGPTGSGKTTTLYAALNQLKSIEKNIVTIEDPVEFQFDIINQNQVNEAIGLTFHRLLRHTLRQDPDIIMVGEIRDRETAEIAVQSALTGHLVLSTLHTNSALGAISRLTDMGVEPYLLSSSLIGVMGQRLVRQVCANCKTSYLAPPELIRRYGWDADRPIRLVKGRGCTTCYDSGYKGRFAIHELMLVDETVQHLITAAHGPEVIDKHLVEQGYRKLFNDGLNYVLDGRTTPEEIAAVIDAH